MRLTYRKKMAAVLFDLMVVGLFAAMIICYEAHVFSGEIDLQNMLSSPSLAHPLGTDNLGRDLLARITESIWGGVIPIWGGVLGGCTFGFVLAVFFISARSIIAVRIVSLGVHAFSALLASIPIGILTFVWAAWWEQTGYLPVMICLAMLFSIQFYFYIYSLYLRDKNLEYWLAHKVIGGSLPRRIWTYGIKKDWKWPILETISFYLKISVAIEASLSYLGFGIQEPQPSFGNILASHFDLYLKGQWWTLMIVIFALAITAGFPVSVINLIRNCFKKS